MAPSPHRAQDKRGEPDGYSVTLHPSGAVLGWSKDVQEDEPAADSTTESARRIALHELAELLRWSEAPIPADAPPVVRQAVTVAAVDGLEPGIYDAELNLVAPRAERELREGVGFAAMEQAHPRDAAANVFQLGDLDAIVERLGDRGYRWAQLEAGIRAGRTTNIQNAVITSAAAMSRPTPTIECS